MQLTQYSQMSVSNKFQKYDYGKEKNLKKYGQAEPPLYNLSNIIVPLVMYYGKHDILIKEPVTVFLRHTVGILFGNCSSKCKELMMKLGAL
jgi:hypothetical protein